MGDLGDLAVGALGAVLVERCAPGALGQGHDRLADCLGEAEADREADAPFVGPVEHFVAGAGRVAAKQNLGRLRPIDGDLLERGFCDRDLIGGGVGAGVARPQHPRSGLR